MKSYVALRTFAGIDPAYVETNGQAVELDQLVPHMLATFIDADRGFQTWRKSGAGKASAAA
jgi:hypothetical protein